MAANIRNYLLSRESPANQNPLKQSPGLLIAAQMKLNAH